MVNGELGTRNWLRAPRLRHLTAALSQFTIQNLPFTIQTERHANTFLPQTTDDPLLAFNPEGARTRLA
jgi:hypothetical protein